MTGLNPAFRDAVLAKRAGLAPPLVPSIADIATRPAERAEARQLMAEARKLFALAVRERAEAARVLANALVEADLIRTRAAEVAELPLLPSVREIIGAVAARHGLAVSAILGARKSRQVVAARHEAIALAHAARPDLSLSELGRLFKRDHTSIHHVLRKQGRGG